MKKVSPRHKRPLSRRDFLKRSAAATAGAAALSWGLTGREAFAGGALDEMLESVRRQYNLPAMAGALGLGGEVMALGVAGRRRAGGQELA